MNKRGHVLNAAFLAIGVGVLLEPGTDLATARAVAEVGVPVVLGALVPDIDAVVGEHRKTLHNLPVLAVFYAWPAVFGNLHHVWIGVLTHYVLDMLGTRRGIALFYPWRREFELPVGVRVDSRYALAVTVLVTAVELAAVAAVLRFGPAATELSTELASAGF